MQATLNGFYQYFMPHLSSAFAVVQKLGPVLVADTIKDLGKIIEEKKDHGPEFNEFK
jgi:hypothetical protein